MQSLKITEYPVPTLFPEQFARCGYQALLTEATLTPKPGLVDCRNNGAHLDMTIGHFFRSARTIGRWLPVFARRGMEDASLPAEFALARLRPAGLACESHMLRATGGVNTHKGSIFSLGLLCCAYGRLHQQKRPTSATAICAEVAAMCHGVVARELEQDNPRQTAGQRLFAAYGLPGARGEAEQGYPLVINGALPLYHRRIASGFSEHIALTDCLLWLMAHNDDTNVVSRGGMEGLRWLQQRSAELLAQGCEGKVRRRGALLQFDDECIARNLSSGGSADLLSVTWLLAQCR